MGNATTEQSLIPGLPDEVGMECLLRVPFKSFPCILSVCRRWRFLLRSPEFKTQRRLCFYSDRCICLVQSKEKEEEGRAGGGGCKSVIERYGISVYDGKQNTWEWLPPNPDFPNGIPLFSHCFGVGQKLVVLGGWHPDTWQVSKCVHLFDFATWRSTRGNDMLSFRSFFACGTMDGRIFVAGGHDDNKNALRTAEVYDVAGDEWSTLAPMQHEWDECKGAIVEGKFYVLSGYGTEMQGQFVTSGEVLDLSGTTGLASPTWWLVEDMCRSPASSLPAPPEICVAYRRKLHALLNNHWSVYDDGQNVWKVLDSVPEWLSHSPCATFLGDEWIFTSASPLNASSFSPYLVRPKQGDQIRGQWTKLNPPPGFSGLPLSACTVEI